MNQSLPKDQHFSTALFTDFLYLLRDYGVPVSPKDLLDLGDRGLGSLQRRRVGELHDERHVALVFGWNERSRDLAPEQMSRLTAPDQKRDEPRDACVFRSKSAGYSGMKSATDSDLISAIPI